MAFQFKQFSVDDDRSTMLIGTDAVLLGAWAEPSSAKSILEIGTGCGVISLMLAQRSNAQIDAIDIDEESVKQAEANFRQSPWNDQLHSHLISLQEFAAKSEKQYDLIITNPPFFVDSLQSPSEKKNRARHTTKFSRKEFIKSIRSLLKPEGNLLIILPFEESRKLSVLAEEEGLTLQKQMNVSPKAGKPFNRILSSYCFFICESSTSEDIVIRGSDNRFTREYITFTDPYYLSLQ
jgi:tRNA1Val (adenine37-N6)-methyltransferase